MSRIECDACIIASMKDKKGCPACGGLGYVEIFERLRSCTASKPECPIIFDPMCHGWECEWCGDSGPL